MSILYMTLLIVTLLFELSYRVPVNVANHITDTC